MSIRFSNEDGEKITGLSAVARVCFLLPLNLLILGYLAMILFGVIHSGAPHIPALGFWYSLCAVALFTVLAWDKGPITWGGGRA